MKRIIKVVILIFIVSLLVVHPHCVRADGEIYLFRGDLYRIPCLEGIPDSSEYEIIIENPDIVGLDDSGKSIVAVAAGVSEVTVWIAEPYAAYSYLFVVGEYYEGQEYEEDIMEEETVYDTDEIVNSDESVNESVTAESEQGEVFYTGEETQRFYVDSSRAEPDHYVSDTESAADSSAGSVNQDFEENIDYWEDITEKAVNDEPEETYSGEKNRSPILFCHGTGKNDLLVPPNYTLWVCAKCRDRVTFLYVGVNGVPVACRIRGNILYIRSDDLPSGRNILQVMAADRAGNVYAMSDYEIYID